MTPIPFDYNYSLIIISILIAIFASFTTIELVGIARNAQHNTRKKWLITASFTMGIGIWTMHFTGMIASGIGDSQIRINLIATIVSFIVAMIGSLIAFRLIANRIASYAQLVLAGTVMGLAISSMHYIGMYAVEYNHYMEHNPGIVALSIVIGITGSTAALIIFNKVSDKHLYLFQLPIAIILGIAISSMHYVAMESFTLYNLPNQHHSIFPEVSSTIDSTIMINTLVIMSAVIFLITYTMGLRNKRLQLAMYDMAFHDSVTGLPNRYYFDQQFQRILETSKANHESFAILFLDLDNFKRINDEHEHGHDAGDRFLKQIGKSLSSLVGQEAVIARYGGDEFIIITQKTDKKGAETVANKITAAFDAPFIMDGKQQTTSFSIGISYFPQNGKDMETLIRQADKAMYVAKQKGKNQYTSYQSETPIDSSG